MIVNSTISQHQVCQECLLDGGMLRSRKAPRDARRSPAALFDAGVAAYERFGASLLLDDLEAACSLWKKSRGE